MRDAVKVLAAIVCVASASGIDLIDGFLKGFSIGNRGEDDDDDDFKGKARSDRSFLSDLENAHGVCTLHCLFVRPLENAIHFGNRRLPVPRWIRRQLQHFVCKPLSGE